MTSHFTPPTKGRCPACAITYEWLGAPDRKHARCPRCGGELRLGRRGQAGRLLLERPADARERAGAAQ